MSLNHRYASSLLFLFLVLLTTTGAAGFQPRKLLDERQSSGKVMGYVACDACFEKNLTKNSILIPGVTVALTCKLAPNQAPFYSAVTKTDTQGRFLFDLPPQIANSDAGARLCSTRVLKLPSTGACSSAPSNFNFPLTFHAVLQGHRIFGTGPFVYTPSTAARVPSSCSSNKLFKAEKATPSLPALPSFGGGFPFTFPALSPPSLGSGIGSGVGSGVGSGIGSGIGSGVGPGIGSGIGSGVGSGIGSGVGTGIGSGIGPGIGSGTGTGLPGVTSPASQFPPTSLFPPFPANPPPLFSQVPPLPGFPQLPNFPFLTPPTPGS